VNRRVWDAFLFCDELDLLECRLTELDDAVYRHVLVEAPFTHQGDPKPLHYQDNRDRFAPWADKIIHVVADLPGGTPKERENAQREAAWKGLEAYRPGDILLHGDVDEIPRADICQDMENRVTAMRLHILAVNLLDPGWWPGMTGAAGRVRLNSMRDGRFAVPRKDVIYDGGWHFSWLGGPEAIRSKVRSFMHPEMRARVDTTGPEVMYRDRINPREEEGSRTLLLTDIDGSWPRYMRERRGPKSWYWPGGG
jgi:glycosyl transferase family 17